MICLFWNRRPGFPLFYKILQTSPLKSQPLTCLCRQLRCQGLSSLHTCKHQGTLGSMVISSSKLMLLLLVLEELSFFVSGRAPTF